MTPTKYAFYKAVNYRYLLMEDLVVQTQILGAAAQVPKYITLTQGGLLIVHAGYCCDGPSWAPDTDDFIAGAFVHDALYQLIRSRRLGEDMRLQADEELIVVCKRAGMSWWKRALVKRAVNKLAAFAAKPTLESIYRVVA